MSKKLTKKLKEKLSHKIDWEGGSEDGAVLDMVKGTSLEKPFNDLQKALNEAETALEKEGING